MASGSCDPSAKVAAAPVEGMLTVAIGRLFSAVNRIETIIERADDELAPVSMARPIGNDESGVPLSGVGKADDVLLAAGRIEVQCDKLISILDSLSI